MTKYIVTAEPKSQSAADKPADQIQFVIDATDYKSCWIAARNLCRTGSTVALADATNFNLTAGLYTVRKIFLLDKPKRTAKNLTVDHLIAAAAAENVKLSKSIVDLIDRLKTAS